MVNAKVVLLGIVLIFIGIITAPGFAAFFVGFGIPIPDLSAMLSGLLPIALPLGIQLGHIILFIGVIAFAAGLKMY
jgi:hypothetical protein